MARAHTGRGALSAADLERARAIRRRVRLESGRPDGRCGKVAEALGAQFGWAYRWGHLRLLDGGMCWIHCWNQLVGSTIVDATADQFEERWLGGEAGVVVLAPGGRLYANYRAAPPGHLFRTSLVGDRRRLLARRGRSSEAFDVDEREIAAAPDTDEGWAVLGACAVQAHSGWPLPDWIGWEAAARLRAAEPDGRALPSRELEFALDAAALARRRAEHGEWTSPEWRAAQAARG